ncbi:MAG: HAD-IA family hydrolase [bacterium]|nr:HAD-IA family hydrolase [bacterium]
MNDLMRDKKYLLFDLDGTLTDPKEGITKSVQHALRYYGIEEPDLERLTPYIGPPLQAGFMEQHGLSERDAEEAVWKYREYFETQGIWENRRYEGILPLLRKLKEKGYVLAMATSKPEKFAKMIAERFEMAPYFTVIAGSLYDGGRTKKAEVIRHARKLLACPPLDECLMIGDRKHDIEGAREVGIDALGVLYGFGDRQELEKAEAGAIVATVEELTAFLC